MAKASLQKGEFCFHTAILRIVLVSYLLSPLPVHSNPSVAKAESWNTGIGRRGGSGKGQLMLQRANITPKGSLQFNWKISLRSQYQDVLQGFTKCGCCGSLIPRAPGWGVVQAVRHRAERHPNWLTDCIKPAYASTRHCGCSRRFWSSYEGLLQVQTAVGWASTPAVGIANT